MSRIGVIGAGAFGSALAANAAMHGYSVCLLARDQALVDKINADHINAKYLPDCPLPHNLTASLDVGDLREVEAILLAVPAQSTRAVLASFAGQLPDAPMVLCAKGIERQSGQTQSEVAQDVIGNQICAVLTGPGFAAELAVGKPTALSLACKDERIGAQLQKMLSNPALRLYLTEDRLGVELGGALKNVYAIACGLVVGSGLGESARAALITRGFAELSALAEAAGAKRETLSGLSGLGDLTLTCTSPQSRNYMYGLRLAQSGDAEVQQTVEGIPTAEATLKLAARYGVEMPIASAVAAVLRGDQDVRSVAQALMTRPLRREAGR